MLLISHPLGEETRFLVLLISSGILFRDKRGDFSEQETASVLNISGQVSHPVYPNQGADHELTRTSDDEAESLG
jgi:hypothetical protein